MDVEDVLLYVAVAMAGLVLVAYACFPDPPKTVPITIDRLKQFDGVQKPQRLLGCNGFVFNVTNEPMYGPEGSYHLFAGHDASVALAKMDLSGAHLDEDPEAAGLSEIETKTLKDWEATFRQKYPLLGRLQYGKKQN